MWHCTSEQKRDVASFGLLLVFVFVCLFALFVLLLLFSFAGTGPGNPSKSWDRWDYLLQTSMLKRWTTNIFFGILFADFRLPLWVLELFEYLNFTTLLTLHSTRGRRAGYACVFQVNYFLADIFFAPWQQIFRLLSYDHLFRVFPAITGGLLLNFLMSFLQWNQGKVISTFSYILKTIVFCQFWLDSHLLHLISCCHEASAFKQMRYSITKETVEQKTHF